MVFLNDSGMLNFVLKPTEEHLSIGIFILHRHSWGHWFSWLRLAGLCFAARKARHLESLLAIDVGDCPHFTILVRHGFFSITLTHQWVLAHPLHSLKVDGQVRAMELATKDAAYNHLLTGFDSDTPSLQLLSLLIYLSLVIVRIGFLPGLKS